MDRLWEDKFDVVLWVYVLRWFPRDGERRNHSVLVIGSRNLPADDTPFARSKTGEEKEQN